MPFSNTFAHHVNRGKLVIAGPFEQLVGTTFTAGIINVGDNSELQLAAGAKIVTNKGTIDLNGRNSIFTAADAWADNQG